MCGINGILRLDPSAAPVDRDELLLTRDHMIARGPDGQGEWLAPHGGAGLAHRRLAIIDLSPAGLQPMSRADGRHHIVFNGEIYNYQQLRRELTRQGVSFRSHSDTEVILALYERYGVAMLSRLRGMYALAIWDENERDLLLARDPYGIKPLYYAEHGGYLRFASQVKALHAGGRIAAEVDAAGVCGFLLWGSVPEPRTLYSAIRAVPAGNYVRVRQGRVDAPVCHSDFGRVTPSGSADVAAACEDSVRAHLVSDVPVAVFLSAGLDSSLIAALAQRHQDRPLTTLTLKFADYAGTAFDEAPLATEVARTLGTHHVERLVRREEFLDLWPAALAAMDQPSIDGFNTFVVSRAARQEGFKVVLSGLGGDELFGSYDSFGDVPRWSRWAARLARVPGLGRSWPALAARIAAERPKLAGLLSLGGDLPGSYFLRRGLFLPGDLPRLLGERFSREGLEAYDPLADAGKYLGDGLVTDAPGGAAAAWIAVHLMESSQFMRNQLLRDSDWASMAHSLELRVPLVDVPLRQTCAAAGFEPALSSGKAEVVRRAAPELPDALWNRPKTGFTIPVMEWLDDQVGIDSARGMASRKLALKVLEQFGVELAPAGH